LQILLSTHAGFCFGVKRAAQTVEENLNNGKKVYTLGMLIHNDDYNEELKRRGVHIISVDELENIPKDSLVIIRTHGEPKSTYDKLNELNLRYIDATCPYVKKIHNIVLSSNTESDKIFVILGDAQHPEVKGIVGFLERAEYHVFSNLEELIHYSETANTEKTHIFLAQTTQNVLEWKKCLNFAKNLYTNLIIFDTICSVTENRQSDAEKIAKKSDLMIVIGGKHSSNTKKLASVSSAFCETIQIENANDINTKMFRTDMTVGITAGASTPDSIIKEVLHKMSIINVDDNMSFEEMLNQSFKTLHPGEEVTGIIRTVLPNEVHIDLGIKHTGILSSDEIILGESSDLRDMFKAGDEVTVLIQKFNDQEGTVKVSKKQIDNRKNWKKVNEAFDADAILQGKVTSVIKGGVLVSYEGQSIFVPASRSGLPKDADLSTLLNETVNFKIIEIDFEKKRIIGSLRDANREIKKAAAEQFWSSVEEGKVYTGKVRSLTNFGAFIDLGGVDGMIHITELSWEKVKHPSDILKVGDSINVFVKSFDKETKKISLGYRLDEDNPWNKLPQMYSEGDVINAKIVSITAYGAFATVIPGIDGLIHISQIANKKLAKPDDVLKVGDEVTAKILEINYETKKVSLSIRALIEEAEIEEAGEEGAVYSADVPVAEEAVEAPAEEAAE